MAGRTPQVVLVGAGHAHLHLASRATEFVRRGYAPVLINPGAFWYSGMATGLLGGRYTQSQDTVDPRPLIENTGGRFIDDRVASVDTSQRTISLASGRTVPYELLSFNIGSQVDLSGFSGSTPNLWPVKPIANLWRLRRHLEDRFRQPHHKAPHHILIIGGGATGSEIAANIDALARRYQAPARVRICTGGSVLLPEAPAGASRRLKQVLSARDIRITTDCHIERLENGVAVDSTGREFSYQIAVAATGLRAPEVMRSLGLPFRDTDGLTVTNALHSPADSRVFGAGDCIALADSQLPKLGVFSLREAPVLLHNLLATIDGTPLRKFRPQSHSLRILNLGRGKSLAVRGQFHWYGRLSQWLKHLLDTRFVRQYQQR